LGGQFIRSSVTQIKGDKDLNYIWVGRARSVQ
jgi:hypothetical protein